MRLSKDDTLIMMVDLNIKAFSDNTLFKDAMRDGGMVLVTVTPAMKDLGTNFK